MRAHPSWSYAPYRPPFFESGGIYLCRVVPHRDRIEAEWLGEEGGAYTLCVRPRGSEEAPSRTAVTGTAGAVGGLSEGVDYELWVEGGGLRSRTRLAHTGEAFGTVVNYLHPEDGIYGFSGRALCSPSLVKLPGGALLASMDVFQSAHPQKLTLIFRSLDGGKTWRYLSELFPCFWGKLFVHGGALYMLACSTEYGDLLIGRSDDGGRTFGEPRVLLRGGGGKNGEPGVHKNPQPLVAFNGRLWGTLEWGSWGRGYHAAMVMSAPLGADLLSPESWAFSEPVKYSEAWPGVPAGPSTGCIEGCLAEIGGTLYNVMRYDMSKLSRKWGLAVAFRVDTERPEAPLVYDHCIEFPGSHTKFVLLRHPKNGRFYSLVTRVTSDEEAGRRNLLSLIRSEDGEHWELDRDVMDCRDQDPAKVGFQYTDMIAEGDEILFLCRTAMNGAANFHDANYSVFGRLRV